MKKITLRVPDDLHKQLVEAAEKNQRSMHGQIVWIIKKSLNKEESNE